METSGRLNRGDGTELAWRRLDGTGATIVFLPGFRSDMNGQKAVDLSAFCSARDQPMLRFDYSGHGASQGRFEEGTIGGWTQDTLTAIDRLTDGPLILIGSSMGGWIALLAALQRPDRIAGLVGIAAAPDFTEALIWESLSWENREKLMQSGAIHLPSAYGDPTPITRGLIEDGRRNLLLGGPIALGCPVRLLHGQNDPDVPWQMSLRLAGAITGGDVQVTLVKDGDHRLSRPGDLALLRQTVASLLDR